MNVTNDSWQLVGDGADASLVMQNVGTSRIAYTFAASQPASDGIELDSDEHYLLHPGTNAVTILDLDTYSLNCYARALGPINGKLAVTANT